MDEIQPMCAYSDAPFAIALVGSGLRPSLAVDTHSGSAGVTSDAFDITLEPIAPADGRSGAKAYEIVWVSAKEIDARLAEGLLAGDYHVAVRDVHGHSIESHAVFTSLGPDNDPPHVAITQPAPGAFFGPDSQIQVEAHVDDGPAPIDGADWTVTSASRAPQTGHCKVDPVDHTCKFSVPALSSSSTVETVDIRVDVRDQVGHTASAEVQVQVVWTPDVSGVMPGAGSTRGGTIIVIAGAGLVSGVSRILVDHQPIGGVVDGDSITGVTPAHAPGTVQLAVSNGYGTSPPLDFRFVPPPILRLINPTHAPSAADVWIEVAGNDFTADTRFSFEQDGNVWSIPPLSGAAASVAPPYAMYEGPSKYTLHLGPGSGTITLHAEDDVGGASPPLVDAFTYDPPPTP